MDAHPLDRVREARATRDEADREFRAAVVEAFNEREGFTVADIEAAAGLSRARVYQIVSEEEER